MDTGERIDQLFQYASMFEFEKFTALFDEIEMNAARRDMSEAYMMRAQIKLFAADISFTHDIVKAGLPDRPSRFPCLNAVWPSDSPNRFIVFPLAPSTLTEFIRTLPRAELELQRWYGDEGGRMVRQLQNEINYFQGHFNDAIMHTSVPPEADETNCVDMVLSKCVLFRSYLASGAAEKAEQSILDIIGTAKIFPKCRSSYRSLRTWANLTTGWCGETERFYESPEKGSAPLLKDRLDAVHDGFSRTTRFESPFLEYAAARCKSVYSIRDYYMDVFYAMLWVQAEHWEKARVYTERIDRIISSTGLVTPLVECGNQIRPFLDYTKKITKAEGYYPYWLARTAALAGQYEQGIRAYRA